MSEHSDCNNKIEAKTYTFGAFNVQHSLNGFQNFWNGCIFVHISVLAKKLN